MLGPFSTDTGNTAESLQVPSCVPSQKLCGWARCMLVVRQRGLRIAHRASVCASGVDTPVPPDRLKGLS